MEEIFTKLEYFVNHFNSIYAACDTQYKFIVNLSDNLQNLKVQIGLPYYEPDPAFYDEADRIAHDIIQAKCKIESTFINYCPQNYPLLPSQPEPIFIQWLGTIRSFIQLVSRHSPINLDVSQVQSQLEKVVIHLDHLNSLLNSLVVHLQVVKSEANTIPFGAYGTQKQNLCSLYWMEWNQIIGLNDTILEEYKISIFQKYSLLITEQPRSVLMKLDKKPVPGTQRDNKTLTTRTNVSVKLINFLGQMSFPDNPVSIQMGMINERTVQEIMKPDFAKSRVEYVADIFSCEVGSVKNFETFLVTDLKQEVPTDSMEDIAPGWVHQGRIPNISVIKVERERDRSRGSGSTNSRVMEEKYYFLVTAIFIYKGNSYAAWAISTPMVINTNACQLQDALATSAWTKYFPEDNLVSSSRRDDASIPEIRNVIKLCFNEWTEYEDVDGNKTSLDLDDEQLTFLVDMLLEDVASKLGQPQHELNNRIPLEFFFYQKLATRNFSIWSWLYKNAILLKKRSYLRELYLKGYVKGFIGKVQACNLLTNNNLTIGDFIIRYSQSVQEELSVVFVNKERNVEIYPLKIDHKTEETFKRTFLEEMYKSCWTGEQKQYVFINLVYPRISKVDAFPRPTGRTTLIRRLPGVIPYVDQLE